MNKVETTVKITNYLNGKVEKQEIIQSANPNSAATKFAQKYRDCGIQLSWNGNYISTQPLNMKADDDLVIAGLMTSEEFVEKWYQCPDVENFDEDEIRQELEREYATEEDIDPWELDKPEED